MNPFQIFWNAVRNHYADIEGRSSRTEYLWFIIIQSAIRFVLTFVMSGSEFGGIFLYVLNLSLFFPGLSLMIRRCHDTNRSGYILLFPLVNIFALLRRGDIFINKYGRPPLNQ